MFQRLPPFVLFAQARSGSSNLMWALRKQPRLTVCEEPFHEKYPAWNPGEPDYANRITSAHGLETASRDLFSRFGGIKVLDYQLSPTLYDHLLLKPGLKVLALTRRSILRQIVSGFIAEQTGVWKRWEGPSDLKQRYGRLAPIDVAEIRARLAYSLELRAHFRQTLARKPPGELFWLEYESLYTTNVAANFEMLRRVFEFLETPPPPLTTALRDLLDPATSKINSEALYRCIPNCGEIDREFGDSRVGYLLES